MSLLLRYVLVLVWMALIFGFSHQVSEVSSGQSGWVIGAVQSVTGTDLPETLVRKSAHALVYLVLGVLVLWLLRGHGLVWRRAAVLAVIASFIYACSDELHQMFIPGRSAEVGDVLLDTMAAIVGVGLSLLLVRSKRPLLVAARVAWSLTVLSSLVMFVSLVQAGVVPVKFIVITAVFYTLLLSGLGYLVFRRQYTKGITIGVLMVSLLLAASSLGIFAMSRNVQGFLSAVQPNSNYVEFSVLAAKERSVALDSARSMVMIKTDPLYEPAQKAAKAKTEADMSATNDLTSLTELIRAAEVELGVARTAQLAILEENYPEFYSSLEVLTTFRVKDDGGKTAQADIRQPFVVYISGIDTYGDIDTSSRSDVNMLAVVNPGQRKMLLVNTPRDYYVQLHGTSGLPDKLTHAGVYGVHMSRQTLEGLYGVKVSHYVRLNFTSLVKLIDVIGPVEVQSDFAFNSFQLGSNTLDSKRALEFARERYSFSDGDRQRGRNQQLVIEGIVAKLSEPSNITRYSAILRSLEGSVQTDISQESLAQFVRIQLDDMKRWHVESISVDGVGSTQPTYSMGSTPLYVMIPDKQTVDAAKKSINEYLGS